MSRTSGIADADTAREQTSASSRGTSSSSENKFKSVCFASYIEVHETIHRCQLNGEEKDAYWYNETERKASRDEATAIVRKLERGKKLNKRVCARGLETHTTKGYESRRIVQLKARTAVLTEQMRQTQKEKSANIYSIAFAYEEHTFKSQQHAYMRGISDQKERLELWRDTSGEERHWRWRLLKLDGNVRLQRS